MRIWRKLPENSEPNIRLNNSGEHYTILCDRQKNRVIYEGIDCDEKVELV